MVAIDRPGGSGKSLFAERHARHLGALPIIHTADVASWDNPHAWWERLERDVLGRLERGEPARFQAYDWSRRELGPWREIPVSDIALVEGVSAARAEIVERLSLAIWLEAPRAVRLRRGIARDGENMRSQWQRWMAEEDAHFEADKARARADLMVSGAPSPRHDPEEEFIVLR